MGLHGTGLPEWCWHADLEWLTHIRHRESTGLWAIRNHHWPLGLGCVGGLCISSLLLLPLTPTEKKKISARGHTHSGCCCWCTQAVYLSTFFQLLLSDLRRNNVSLFLSSFTLFHLSTKAQALITSDQLSVANNNALQKKEKATSVKVELTILKYQNHQHPNPLEYLKIPSTILTKSSSTGTSNKTAHPYHQHSW